MSSVTDLFVPRECLVNEPFEAANADVWASCAARRTRVSALILFAVVLVAAVALLLLFRRNRLVQIGAAVALALALLYVLIGPMYRGALARRTYQAYEQQYAAYQRVNPGASFSQFTQYQQSQKQTAAAQRSAGAQTGLAAAQGVLAASYAVNTLGSFVK